MKKKALYILIGILSFLTSCNEQDNRKQMPMENFELAEENAHEKAQKLLTEDFYWNPIEEGGPFGNDDGHDAFYSFYQWRKVNTSQSPLIFLKELIAGWGYPEFNLSELDSVKIEEYINSNTAGGPQFSSEQMKEIAKNVGLEFDETQFKEMYGQIASGMGGTYLMSTDNAIIAVGFGQYILEGKIDKELYDLTKIALQRESMPILINKYVPEYRDSRLKLISQMTTDLEQM